MFNLIIKKLTIIIAVCKKTYPNLINLKKWVLLLTGIKNTRGHYARKKFYVIQPVTRVDSDLSSYDMIEWLEEQKYMRLTVRCGEAEDVTVDAALSQRISPGRLTSGRNRWKANGRNGCCEKSVTKQNRISDCWLFEKLEIMKNGGLLTLVTLVIMKIEILISFDKYKNWNSNMKV